MYSSRISVRTQKICLWTGPASVLLFMLGFWVVAGFVPPPSPNASAEEIAAFFAEDRNSIRIGMVITQVAATISAAWVAVITLQMRRVEGPFSPLAYTQLGMGMLNVLLFAFPAIVWEVAAFRADRDPQFIQFANDLAWLPFVGIFAPAAVQFSSVAWCAFKDEQQTVFPRWFGYANLWLVIGILPTSLIYFFKTGPLAWDGVIAFWIPFWSFFAWFAVTFVVLYRALNRQSTDAPTPTTTPSQSTAPTPSFVNPSGSGGRQPGCGAAVE